MEAVIGTATRDIDVAADCIARAIFIGGFFFSLTGFFSKKFIELYFGISQGLEHAQEFRNLEKVGEKLRFSMQYLKF
jgi:hypothetical protein